MAQVIEEQGGGTSSVLSDLEWSRLCEAASHADSDESAIAKVVMRAYGLGLVEPSPAPSPEEYPQPVPAGPALSPAIQYSPNQQPWPATADRPVPTTAPAFGPDEPVPGYEAIPVSFVGKAWPIIDAPVPMPTQPAPGVNPLPPTPVLLAPPSPASGGGLNLLPVELIQPQTSLPAAVPVEQKSLGRRAHTRRRSRVMEDRRRERLLTVASWVRNIGAIILLFVAWQLWGTAITQHHTQAALEHQFAAKVHHAPVKAAPGFTLIPATTRIPDPPQGTVMAHLQIPKISLDQYVVSGTAEADLAKGPGHYLGTAMPGQAGNVAIAGHRTTHGAPFNRLAELAIGDPIYLTTSSGQTLTYIVSAVPVAVSPSDVTVLNNFGDDRLTLTTCNPEYSAVQRLIVVAAYLPPGATHPVAIAKGSGKPYALAPAETSGWNTTLLPLVAIEILALAGLGLAFGKLSKVYGRGARWLILVPVWLALLLALFETLTNFLPAAV